MSFAVCSAVDCQPETEKVLNATIAVSNNHFAVSKNMNSGSVRGLVLKSTPIQPKDPTDEEVAWNVSVETALSALVADLVRVLAFLRVQLLGFVYDLLTMCPLLSLWICYLHVNILRGVVEVLRDVLGLSYTICINSILRGSKSFGAAILVLLVILTIDGNIGRVDHTAEKLPVDFCDLLNLLVICCLIVVAPIKRKLIVFHRYRFRMGMMNQGTRSMKRKIASGHIRSITSSNKENVGVANFGKRIWKLRPSTLIFHMNKKEEPTKTEKSEKSRSPFMVICVVEYVQQLIEIVQEMFSMYFDEIWYRYDRRPCSVSLASNFTQVMNELVDDCSVGLLLGAISVQVATRTCPVIFGGISIGLIMAHFHFRKPRCTEANQRAPEASWQAQASRPRNDIHDSSDPHVAVNAVECDMIDILQALHLHEHYDCKGCGFLEPEELKDLGTALLWKGGDKYGPQHVSADQLHRDSERDDHPDDTDY